MNTFSDQLVLWVINVLIHSSVLTAVLLCVAMLFRKRAAMRYWILCCGLLLVLASPAVSALVQSQGTGWLTLALPDETVPTATVAATEQPMPANDSPMESLPTQQIIASIAPPVLDASSVEEFASTPVVSKPMMVPDVPANPSPTTATVKDSRSPMQWLAIIVTIATVVWAMGATLLLMRMTIGWIRLAGILRRAEPIADPGYVAAFIKACALAGCHEGHTPRLVASDEISGPLAAGIFAGSVVLPKRLIADSSPTELAEVFVHEVAHVVRRDQIVVLLQNLVAAIYWPHPLVRKLNRELAKAREEVCDNFVLATTEAPIYSRTLLSLAQLVQQPETIPGSVGFFASRWKLEHRVAGLLDEARDTQTFLSRRGWAFVLASTVGLLAAICVGTVTIATAQNSNEDSVAESEANSSEIEISGIVCEQSGDPIGGATIWLAVTSFEFNSEVNMENREGLLRELGSTDERGRFDFLLDEATTSEIRERSRFARVQIVATSDGHGMDWLPLDVFQDDPIPNKERYLLQSRIDDAFGDGRFASRTLVMRPESQPVRGRIIDLEGNRLSNVTVIVESLRQPNVPQLTNALENAWKQGVYDAMNSTGIAGGLARSELQKLFPPAKTDENGEFQIRGIGDDQLATLVFQDERIEACPVHVVGREMETLSLPHMDQYPDGTKDLFVGREFNYSAAPSIPVEGTVTDYDTGKPISGVLVSVERLFRREYAKLRLDTRQMRSVTDEQGRFRIIGMPPGDGHIIEAVPPKSEPYLPAPQEVSLSLEDGKTKRIEIQVKRGVWIEGRITDKESGEPRSAAIEYMAMGKNPYAMDIAGWDPKLRLDPVRVYQRYVTDSDGRYRLPGLSGPGVLLVTSLDPGYPLAAGAETIDGYDPSTGKIPTLPVPFPASDWHLLKQINPAKDATSLTSDLTLDGGVRIPGRVVGPDGKPISNLYALGLTEGDPYWTPNSPDKALLTERFMVNGYDGKGPRQSFFKNQDETLVGQYRLEGTAPPEIAVKLEPSVRVTGRLIENETGLPAARYFVGCQELLLNGNAPPLDFMIRWCHTNNAGEFEIKGLMAGHVYKMKAHNRIGNKVDFTIDLTKAKPGETIELADVPQPGTHGANDSISSSTMKKSNAVASVSTGSRQNKSEDQAAHSPIRITGRVIDPNGNPVSGAKIFYAGSLVEPLSDEEQAIPLAVCQQNGSFEFAIPLSKRSQSYDERLLRYGTVVATLDGFAPAVANLHDSVSDQPLELRLAIEDEPLSGRILDLQGQPVPKVKVTFNALEVPVPDSLGVGAWRKMLANRPDGMAVQRKFFSLAMLPSFLSKRQVETDAEGRFEMPSFGSGRIVALLLESPTIQTQEIRVVTGVPINPISVPWYENAPASGTLHYVPNNFDFVAGPTRPITGVLSDLETGKPLSGFQVSGGTAGNPMNEIAATTDDEGRFRLTGVPVSGKQTLTVLPPKDQPFIAVQRRVNITPGEDPLEINLEVPRGVWVDGNVVDQQSKESVGANLSYFVFDKNRAYQTLRSTGLGLHVGSSGVETDDEGNFRLAVLPGRGVIAARGFRDDYLFGVGDDLIVEGRQSDNDDDDFLVTAPHLISTSNYHAVAEVNPENLDSNVEITVGLVLGASAQGRVVDAEGQPLAGTLIRGTRAMAYWRETESSDFKALGFTDGKSRQLLFWHGERNLAGQAVIAPGTTDAMVHLQPAATVSGRLLDKNGAPIRDVPIVSYTHGGNKASEVEHDFLNVPSSLDIRTDDQGKFQIPSLVPGLKYAFGIEDEPGRFPTLIIKSIALEPGETRDMGDIEPLSGPHAAP
ncbi:MAG: hypothetical protein NXI28_20285 [bacterium]|nr:hypothetical protein [bacterium]